MFAIAVVTTRVLGPAARPDKTVNATSPTTLTQSFFRAFMSGAPFELRRNITAVAPGGSHQKLRRFSLEAIFGISLLRHADQVRRLRARSGSPRVNRERRTAASLDESVPAAGTSGPARTTSADEGRDVPPSLGRQLRRGGEPGESRFRDQGSAGRQSWRAAVYQDHSRLRLRLL